MELEQFHQHMSALSSIHLSVSLPVLCVVPAIFIFYWIRKFAYRFFSSVENPNRLIYANTATLLVLQFVFQIGTFIYMSHYNDMDAGHFDLYFFQLYGMAYFFSLWVVAFGVCLFFDYYRWKHNFDLRENF